MPLDHPPSGLGNIGEFQASALPWASSSLVTTSSTTRFDFNSVTSFIHFFNQGPGTANVSFADQGSISLPPGSKDRIDIKVKEFSVRSEGSNTTLSVLAGLTMIPSRFMAPLTPSSTDTPVELTVTLDYPADGASLELGTEIELAGTVSRSGAAVVCSPGGAATVIGTGWTRTLTPDTEGPLEIVATASEGGDEAEDSIDVTVIDTSVEETPLTIVSTVSSLAWLDITEETVVVSDPPNQTDVVGVADQVGLGHDFSGVAAPQLEPTAWLSSEPAVVTDGVADYLLNSTTLANLICGGTNNSFYIALTFQFLSSGTNRGIFSIGLSSNANHYVMLVTDATTGGTWRFRRQIGGAAGQFVEHLFGTVDGNVHTIELLFDGTNFSAWDNGVQAFAPTTSTISGAMGVMNRVCLGGRFRAAFELPSVVRCRDFYVANGVPSSDELTALRARYAALRTS